MQPCKGEKNLTVTPVTNKTLQLLQILCTTHKHIKVGKESRKNSCFHYYKQQTFLLFHLQLFSPTNNSTVITLYPILGLAQNGGELSHSLIG